MSANIQILTLDGPIYYDDGPGSYFRWMLKKLYGMTEKANRPKAVILRVNSPGGTVGATEELFQAVRHLQVNGIRVVALMEDVAASGGLYVSMAADCVIAHAGTITGSIGVIMEGTDYSAIMDFLGIKTNVIKSGKFKDIFSGTRPMTNEEHAQLQETIMSVYQQFLEMVAKERRMPIAKVKKFADGRVMSGMQAYKLKLVDGIGGLASAVEVAAKLGKISKNKIKTKFVRRKGWGGGCWCKAKANFLALIPNAKLSGIPLFMMPKFNK